jgi:hypothetical protein
MGVAGHYNYIDVSDIEGASPKKIMGVTDKYF